MELTREVGTFWKWPDDSLYFLIMGTVGGKYSVVYLDTLNGKFYYTTLTEDQTVLFEPCLDMEKNNALIDELSKGGSQ